MKRVKCGVIEYIVEVKWNDEVKSDEFWKDSEKTQVFGKISIREETYLWGMC